MMMKPLMFATAFWMLCGAFTPLQAQVSQPELSAAQHPYLVWEGGYPRWSALTPQQAVADIRKGIELAEQRIEAICRVQPGQAAWENTFAVYDTLDVELGYADQLLSNLAYLMDAPEWRAAMDEVSPLIAEYNASISSNEQLWKVLREASTRPWVRQLSPARQRFVQEVIDAFKDSGVDLPADKKARKLEIEKELAALELQFDKNCKDSANAWQLVISDKAQLAGLSPEWMSRAAAKAQERGFGTPDNPQWLITLDYASVVDVLRQCHVAETRRLCWEGRCTEGNTPEFDNAPVVDRVMALRSELATLLGFGTYADMATARRMVGSGAAALEFVDNLMRSVKPAFDRDVAQLLDFASKRAGRRLSQIDPWDVSYYITQMNKEICGFDSEALRPYHKKENVLAGMFSIYEGLYNIRISECPTRCLQPGEQPVPGEVEVWHPEVKLYAIHDVATGRHMGSVYMDLHPRNTKRDGAWVMGVRHYPVVDGQRPPHLCVLVCNLKAPTAGKPALFTHMDVQTIFHEFGHALHSMLSDTELHSHAGTRVARDFVELPSQINENWTWIPEGVMSYARHWETDAPLQAEMLVKLQKSRFFLPGFEMMSQLRMAKLDLEMHINYESKFRGRNLDTASRELLEPWNLPVSKSGPSIMRCLSHCVSSGYAAGYYSYKWAEVLAADAFTRFEQEGPTNAQTGAAFRREVLSTGGSRSEAETFHAFMGRDPNPDALLQQQGMHP